MRLNKKINKIYQIHLTRSVTRVYRGRCTRLVTDKFSHVQYRRTVFTLRYSLIQTRPLTSYVNRVKNA